MVEKPKINFHTLYCFGSFNNSLSINVKNDAKNEEKARATWWKELKMPDNYKGASYLITIGAIALFKPTQNPWSILAINNA